MDFLIPLKYKWLMGFYPKIWRLVEINLRFHFYGVGGFFNVDLPDFEPRQFGSWRLVKQALHRQSETW